MSSPQSTASVLPLLLKHGFAPQTKSLKVNYRRLHPGQEKVAAEMRRFNVACFGRRWGKSFFCIDWMVKPAVEKGLPVAWFAPTVKMWQEIWSDVITVVGRENIVSKNIQMGRIELKNGGKIDFWSLEADLTVKGRKYARVVFDEAAHAERLENAWIYTVAPTLTDYKGEAFFISTPNGYNYFQTLFEFGNDELKKDWKCWQMSSYENPHIDPAEIDMWKDILPSHVFEQEYLAQFLRDDGKVFRNVKNNILSPADQTPDDHRGHRLIAGVDWAQIKDFTVISIGCDTCKREVFLDRFNKIEFAFQRERLLKELVRWGVAETNVEENSIGRPNYEELVRSLAAGEIRGIKINAFRMTSESKPQIVQSMALSLEKEEFQFLPDPTATNELLSYEAKVNAQTGRIIYTAPAGGHDDTVVARMMMLKAVHAPASFRTLNLRLR